MILQIPIGDDLFQIEFTGPQYRDIRYDVETGETFKIRFEPNSTEDIQIKIPHSFPVKSQLLNDEIHYGSPMVIGDDLELMIRSVEDDCFTYYTITHDNHQPVGVWYATILSGNTVYAGKPAMENCNGIVKAPYDSPYVQLKSGVYKTTIACNSGLELYMRHDSQAVCLKSSTAEILLQRVWFTSEEPKCSDDCQCNWVANSFHDSGTVKGLIVQGVCQ